mmetsp:Transcript_8431/g.21544  ORF Transcript_8431/g.21544 Transcript_8431/m.21544 type:complete len:273 (-) Transcript_8431:1510-2328(-)
MGTIVEPPAKVAAPNVAAVAVRAARSLSESASGAAGRLRAASASASTLLRTSEAHVANRRVEVVSSHESTVGETHAMSTVRALPPMALARSLVSGDSRYGTCFGARRSVALTRVWTTRCSASNEPLIDMACSSAAPVDPDRFNRSEPARSTRCTVALHRRPGSCTVTLNTVCERELRRFIAVPKVARRPAASRYRSIKPSSAAVATVVAPPSNQRSPPPLALFSVHTRSPRQWKRSRSTPLYSSTYVAESVVPGGLRACRWRTARGTTPSTV